VETDYSFMKQRLEIGNFSGKTALSVYQDFHAKVVAKNLTTIIASPAQEIVKQESKDKTHDYQINMTQAFSKSKDTLILLFERPHEIVVQRIQELQALFMAAIEPIRPGRKFKRKHKVNKKEHYMSYINRVVNFMTFSFYPSQKHRNEPVPEIQRQPTSKRSYSGRWRAEAALYFMS